MYWIDQGLRFHVDVLNLTHALRFHVDVLDLT